MNQLVTFSTDDLTILRNLVYRERLRVKNTTGRGAVPDYADSEPTTEVYIAKVYAGGIPALTETPSNEDDIPGSAECEIYQIIIESGTPRLRPIGASQTVYNLSLQDIVEEDAPWIAIKREKFGNWLADGAGVTDVGTGSDADFCGHLILDCPDVITECCDPDTMDGFATLTYKIGSLAPALMTVTKVGDGYSGEEICDVGDGHTEVRISYLSNCFTEAGYVAVGFTVAVYVDASLENYVIWNVQLQIGEKNEAGYQTCEPYSLHYEGFNTGGVALFTNPRTCGSVDYPFAATGGLLLTMDVVE